VVATSDPLKALRCAQEPVLQAASFGCQGGESGYSFAGFRLEADGTLWRGETVVHLPPKELAALHLLLEHAGQVVSAQRLKHALWGEVHVTTDSISKCMSSLRARLEPEACIQTVYKRGYRFSAEVRRHETPPARALLRLAILPFTTREFVPEHLGTAIAEETIASLANAQCAAVAVLARDSVFNLALRGLTAQQLGLELKADLVLTGTLQTFSLHYRLRAEMIRVEDGTEIWVEDMLAPQSQTSRLEWELMRRLTCRLGAGLSAGVSWPQQGVPGTGGRSLPADWSPGGLSIAATAASEDEGECNSRQTEAYEIFLRGRHEWQTLHRHRMQDGLQHLLRAIELDPSLMAAKIDLAHLCVTQAFHGFMAPASSAEIVHRTAESIPEPPHQAIALLPALGWVHFHFDRNLPAALRDFSLSAHLFHDSWITRERAMFALSRHRFAEAIALLRAAIEIDPFAPWLQNRLAWALHLDGRRSQSMEQIQRTIKLFPDHEETGLYGAVILAFNGEAERASRLAQRLAQRLPYFDLAPAVHAYALACAGQQSEARAALDRLQWLGRERYIVRAFTPAAYLALGDRETALAELRAAEQARCPWFFQTLADPRLEPLYGDPEFQQMQAILTGMEAGAEQYLALEE
jgi:DNA-binding winged helix-turn-helix (wHTH) protein/tetratricopeptide (TPR) repeat protein